MTSKLNKILLIVAFISLTILVAFAQRKVIVQPTSTGGSGSGATNVAGLSDAGNMAYSNATTFLGLITNVAGIQQFITNPVTGAITNLNANSASHTVSIYPSGNADIPGTLTAGSFADTAWGAGKNVIINNVFNATALANGTGALTNNGSGNFGWYNGFQTSPQVFTNDLALATALSSQYAIRPVMATNLLFRGTNFTSIQFFLNNPQGANIGMLDPTAPFSALDYYAYPNGDGSFTAAMAIGLDSAYGDCLLIDPRRDNGKDPFYFSSSASNSVATSSHLFVVANGQINKLVIMGNGDIYLGTNAQVGYRLPNTNGSAGQALITDGGTPQQLSWTAVGTGSGSVTSVNVTGPAGVTSSGGPITTSGTITLSTPSYLLTNNESQTVVFSNAVRLDAAHALSLSNVTVSKVAVIGSDNTVTNTGLGAVSINGDGTATTTAQINALFPGNVLTNGESVSTVFSNSLAVDASSIFYISNQIQIMDTIVASTVANGLALSNASVATSSNPMFSPAEEFIGKGFSGASHIHKYQIYGKTFNGTDDMNLSFQVSTNGSSYRETVSINSSGEITNKNGAIYLGSTAGGLSLQPNVGTSASVVRAEGAQGLVLDGSGGTGVLLQNAAVTELQISANQVIPKAGQTTVLGTLAAPFLTSWYRTISGTNRAAANKGFWTLTNGGWGPLFYMGTNNYNVANDSINATNQFQVDVRGTAPAFAVHTNGTIIGQVGFASYKNNTAAPTSITVGASVFNYTNTTVNNIQVFLDANGATTAVTMNGTAIFSSLVAGDHTIMLQPNDWIGVTYSVATPLMRYREF